MLNGSVVVITGASSGIGAALAERLAQEHALLVLAARRRDALQKVAEHIAASGGNAVAVPTDVTVSEEAARLIETSIARFGRIDVLVNNAGRGHCADVETTSDDIILRMFAVNAFALWYTTRPALRQMKKQGTGHIINIASMAGKMGFPYNSAYVAAKHACVGFTHSLRMELLGSNIHASVVCPGGVETGWARETEGRAMADLFALSGEMTDAIALQRGLPRMPIEGTLPPSAIAEAILDCIKHPRPEVYPHQGSEEFIRLQASDREEAERLRTAAVLGEQAAYRMITRNPS